jgi:hypothetical protein
MSYVIDLRAATGTSYSSWPDKRNAIMAGIKFSAWWHDSCTAAGDGEGEEAQALDELLENMSSAPSEDDFIDYFGVLRNTAWEYDQVTVLTSRGWGQQRHLHAV